MFEQQQDEDKQWITHKLVDQQIDKLNISQHSKDKIKKTIKLKILNHGKLLIKINK